MIGLIALIDFFRVKDMAPAKPIVGKKRKYFTVEEANKALPLVRMIVGDIVRQYRVVEDLQQRLSMRDERTAAALERSLRGRTGAEPGRARRRGSQADGLHRGIEAARVSSSRARMVSATFTASWMAARCSSAGGWASRRCRTGTISTRGSPAASRLGRRFKLQVAGDDR